MLRAAEDALAIALEQGNRRVVAIASTYVCLALERGPTPYEGALERIRELAPKMDTDRFSLATLLMTQADFQATMGRFDEAGRDLATASATFTELGQERWMNFVTAIGGHIAELDGRLDDAEAAAREALESLERQADLANALVLTGDLARILNRQGRHEEAEAVALSVSDRAPAYDLEAQAQWRTEAAKAMAHTRPEEARLLAAEAVERAGQTDFVTLQAEARAAEAEVMAAAGDMDAARVAWQQVRTFEPRR
jgi:tetratricopeptide (TPR) repeat protein